MLSGILVSPLLAQYPPGPGGFGQASVTDATPDTIDRFDHRNFQFRSDIGDGVGYAKGFQTFGAFQPITITPDEFILFMNPRGIVTYLGDLAANLGAGVRGYDAGTDRILGFSGWWDVDNTGDRKYSQIGGSFESLGQYLDFRANAYILTDGSPDFLGQQYTGVNRFFQNFIAIGRNSFFDVPLNGGDFEVGGALPGIGDIGVRTYAGGYYYQGDGTGAVYGVRGRIETLITQDLWGGVMITHDKLFGTNVTGAFTWYWGSGQEPRWFQRIPVPDRLYQQVERQYRIAVWREILEETVLALRAGGTGGSGGPVGTPIFVVHVNNTAPAGGDGTFERPLNFLPTTTAGNVDIVFVNRGNGTSSNMNQGITLNDFQRLLGQGVQHQFTSTLGTFTLPGYSPGPLPTITNTSGDAVTLNDFNEVSGFNITGAARHGITDSGIGLKNFNINNVNISNNGDILTNTGAGIQLTDAIGIGHLFNATLTNNAAEGFRIDDSIGAGSLTLTVDNVTATGNLTGISLNSMGADYNVTMTDTVGSSNRNNGIAVNLAAGSTFNGTFDRITANGNTGNGFTLFANASTANVFIEHSTFNNNTLNGLSFIGVNGSTLNIELLNNNATISNNGLNGVFVDLTDSTGLVTMKNNVISNNGNIGAFLQATNGALFLTAGGLGTEDINGNGVLDPGEDANGNGLFDRDGNIFDQNHGAALAYTLRDTAIGTVDIRGNVITRTLDDTLGSTVYNGQGIDIRLTGSTVLSNATAFLTAGRIDRNTIGSLADSTQGNAGGGLVVFADQRTTLQSLDVGTFGNGNVVANNTGIGMSFERRNEAIVSNVFIGNNALVSNTGNGLRILAANSLMPTPDDYTAQNNTITNNGAAGVALRVEADAQMKVDLFDNRISNNTGDGILVTEQANSPADNRSVSGTWNRNTITNNTENGINIDGTTNGLQIGGFTLADGNTITGNQGTGPGSGQGIRITAPGTGLINFNDISDNNGGGVYLISRTFKNWTVTNNIIQANNGDGLRIQSQGPFSVTVNAFNNFIRDNTGRGVNILNETSNGGLTSGSLSVTLDNNFIIGNFQEGVRVVNTAAFGQGMEVGDALLDNGDLNSRPVTFFTMTDNLVEGNGRNSTLTANGLVLLVGTSDGGNSFSSTGGFFDGGTRGGVGATVTDNTFSGNYGDEVFFQSFVSTGDPATTQGTWSDTTFTVTPPYQGDPLARLDLTFTGNTHNSTDVNNPGAFYDNAEGTFKSRQTTSTDPGPFIDADRHRNAQRLAGRFGLPPANGLAFLYPGIGTSTFRLMTAPTSGGFLIDGSPYTNPFTDSQGVFYFGDPGRIEAMPYGWSLAP
ncbi:MAG: beta strand repeat-containing protein [Planctomycetaceae bacterium]